NSCMFGIFWILMNGKLFIQPFIHSNFFRFLFCKTGLKYSECDLHDIVVLP
ncbi:hypothetical protein L9F63_005328, partial [Diploptera punctata]